LTPGAPLARDGKTTRRSSRTGVSMCRVRVRVELALVYSIFH
jgi:hypothetical protein